MPKSARRLDTGHPRSLLWVEGALCGIAAALSPGTALLLVGLLAPGLVSLALDGAPGKPMARAVLLAGVTASISALRQLWLDGASLDAALNLLEDPLRLGTAWAAGATGWLISELAPIITRLLLDARSLIRAKELRAERERLEAEWSLPAGHPPPTSPPPAS